MTDRIVVHTIGPGYITVSGRAYSIPEALALESALRQVAPARAFQPVVETAAIVAEPATVPDESELPPHAVADSEDTTEGLNVQTKAVVE